MQQVVALLFVVLVLSGCRVSHVSLEARTSTKLILPLGVHASAAANLTFYFE